MGDSGSQFIGMFLAWLGVRFLWNSVDIKGEFIQSKNFFIPILIYIVTISDTATVTINRILKGQSPFVGGKDHTTHNLVFNGFSERQVSLLFFLISLFGGIFSLFFIYGNKNWDSSSVLISGFVTVILFGLLYISTRLKKSKR